MDDIEKMLRRSIENIISPYSPSSMPDECFRFDSSSHQEREICFVADGFSRYMLNGSVYESTPGTVFLIDSWTPHARGYCADDHDLLHLWIPLHQSEINASLLLVQKNGKYRYEAPIIKITDAFGKILVERWNMLNARKDVTPEMVTEYMNAPLNAILDEVAFQLFSNQNESESNIDSVVLALKQHIRIMNARNCSYETLEGISGYHRSYLAHRFRRSTGYTIGEYIEKVRIEYTAAAFKRGLKQKEIAFELGFSTAANFWNWLRKHREEVFRAGKC